jgi:hypothetical protein
MAGLPVQYYRNYTSSDMTYDNNHGNSGSPLVTIAEIGWEVPDGYIFKEWNFNRNGTG